jgi:hypothetical protein
MKPGRRVFAFLTSAEPAKMRHRGTDVLSGDIIVNNFDEIHQQTEAEFRLGSISLTTRDLDAACKALTGCEFSGLALKHIVRPKPALMSRLLMLHEMVGRIATTIPEVLEVPEAARSLEQQLIHILGRCLTESASTQMTNGCHRHDRIVARFEEFLKANPNTPLYLPDILRGCGHCGTDISCRMRRKSGNGADPLPHLAQNAPCPPCALTGTSSFNHRNASCYRSWLLGVRTFLGRLSRNVWGSPVGNIAATAGLPAGKFKSPPRRLQNSLSCGLIECPRWVNMRNPRCHSLPPADFPPIPCRGSGRYRTSPWRHPAGRPGRPFSTAEIWTKTSLPPPSGAMKP